jgi:hypothetical protein
LVGIEITTVDEGDFLHKLIEYIVALRWKNVLI